MAEDVQITIGAAFDQLASGVEQAKDSVESLKTGFERLATVFGIGLGLEGIKSFIEHMAELGLQIEQIGRSLGVSNEKVVELGGVAKLTGTDIQTLAMSFERMSLNIQRSTSSAITPQSQALRLLGLSAKELIGLPADEYFAKLADAVSKFNPSLNLTNALMEVGGRAAVRMLPVLLLGGERFRELEAQTRTASAGLAEAADGMAETHEKVTLLGLSVQSLGARIFTVLKPGIDSLVESLTKWVQSIDSSTIRRAVEAIGDFTLTVLQAVGDLALQIMDWFDKLGDKADTLASKASAAAGGAMGGAVGGFAVGGPVGAGIGAAGGGIAGWLFGGAGGGMATFNERFGQFDTARTQFDASVGRWRESFKKWQETLTEGTGEKSGQGAKANAPAINFGAAEAGKLAMQQAETAIKMANLVYQNDQQTANASARMHMTTEQQKTDTLLAAVNQREATELAALNKAEQRLFRGTTEYAKAEAMKTEITQKASNDRNRINQQMMEVQIQGWMHVADTVTGAFTSQLNSLLAGTETFAGAMQKTFANLIEQMIALILKLAVEELVFIALTGSPVPVTALLKGGFAAGTDYVPQTGPYMLHEGERVVPADENRNMTSSNQQSMTVNISAIDSQSFAAALMNNKSGLLNVLQNLQRSNPSLVASAAARG